MELHAVADHWEDAPSWRVGHRRISSWSVRDVATGTAVAAIRLAACGRYRLESDCGARSLHAALMLALQAASLGLSPRSAVH